MCCLCGLAADSARHSGAHSTCASRQMDGDTFDDATIASLLARLREMSLRDAPAEKLHRLAVALESKHT